MPATPWPDSRMSVPLGPVHARGLDLFGEKRPPSSTLAPELDKTSGDHELLSVDWAADEIASLGIPEEMKVNGWQLFWEQDLAEFNRVPTPLQLSSHSTTTHPKTAAISELPATASLPTSNPMTRQVSADTETGSETSTSPDTVLNTPNTACHLPLPPAWSATTPTATQVHDTEAMIGTFYLMSPSPDEVSGAPAEPTLSAASSSSTNDQIELATHNNQEVQHPLPALELPDDLSATKDSVIRPSNRFWTPRPQRKNPSYHTRLRRTEALPEADSSRDQEDEGSARSSTQVIAPALSQRRSKLESEKRTREMYHLPPLPADDSEDELNIKPAKPALARSEQPARPLSPIHRAAWTKAQMHFPKPNERRPYTAKEDNLMLHLVKSPQLSETALQDIAAGLKKRGYERTTSAIKFRLRNTMNERFREKFDQLERPFVHTQDNAQVSEETKRRPSRIPKTRIGKKRRLREDI